MNNINKVENNQMNIIKGLVIILMVMGHAESPINKYLYLFHLATFIFVAGYFYSSKYDENFILLIKNRIRSLYFPYVKYVIIFTILNNFFYKMNLVGNYYEFSKENLMRTLKGIITFNSPIDTLGAFWFIKTLFLCTILFGLISFILKKFTKTRFEYKRAITISILFMLGNIIFINLGVVSMQNIIKVLMCIPIFYAAVLYNKYETQISVNGYLATIALILIYISGNQGKIDIANNIYTSAVYFIGNSILGIYLIVWVSKKLIKVDKNKIFSFIGKNTLPILAGHWLCFTLVDNYIKLPLENVRWIICTLFGVLIPVLIQIIVNVIKDKFRILISNLFR